MKIQGTPKTISEALIQGLRAVSESGISNDDMVDQAIAAGIIKAHVRDFLAQKFAAAMLSSDDPEITKLWQRITDEVAS